MSAVAPVSDLFAEIRARSRVRRRAGTSEAEPGDTFSGFVTRSATPGESAKFEEYQWLNTGPQHRNTATPVALDADEEERAAIMEMDGGLPRRVAQVLARRQSDLLKRAAGPEEWMALDREILDLEIRLGIR